jgi:hypothetical protein
MARNVVPPGFWQTTYHYGVKIGLPIAVGLGLGYVAGRATNDLQQYIGITNNWINYLFDSAAALGTFAFTARAGHSFIDSFEKAHYSAEDSTLTAGITQATQVAQGSNNLNAATSPAGAPGAAVAPAVAIPRLPPRYIPA